jgi:prepilin-type N-terminal cleavage/methylation domain-containing protein
MKLHNYLLKNREAFTLVEILIVVAISALLSTIVIAFSSLSKNEVSVSVEEAKISQFLFQAKTLAMATYAVSSSTCGYGVSFDYANSAYSIFAYVHSNTTSCPSASSITNISQTNMQKYTDSTWNVHLTKGVQFKQLSDSASVILFYPPDPTTLIISLNGSTFTSQTSSSIYLYPTGGNSYVNHISINSAGQITM